MEYTKRIEEALHSEIIASRIISLAIGVVSFVLLMCLSAFIRIPLPFTPVPITGQTFVVLLAGAFLGKRCGSLTQFLYICLGVLGLPVFAGAGFGILYIFGPTGGYIIGFIFASWLVAGIINSRADADFKRCIFAFTSGILCIYLFGIIGLTRFMNLRQAILLGAVPFIPGDIIKILLAVFIYLKLQQRVRYIFVSS